MPLPNKISSRYPRWTFDKFEDYWKIDDSERHNIMLNYFLQCGVLGECDPEDELLLTTEAMDLIIKSDVVSSANNLGSKTAHEESKFHHLRKCVTAEAMLLYGVEKKKITKKLVTHSTVPKLEADRQRWILELGGERMKFSCHSTPVSAYYTQRRTKKNEGPKSLMGTIMDLISPSQKKRQLPEEGDEVNPNSTSEESILVEGSVKTRSESEAAMEDQPTGFLSRILATPKAVLKRGMLTPLKRRQDEDNDKISTPKALFGRSLLSPQQFSKKRRAEAQIGNGGVNQRNRRAVPFEDDLTNFEDGGIDATANPFQESRDRRATDMFGESSSNKEEGEQRAKGRDRRATDMFGESSSNKEEGEQRAKPFDTMEWNFDKPRTSRTRATKVRKAKEAVAMLHSELNGSLNDFHDVLDELNEMVNRVTLKDQAYRQTLTDQALRGTTDQAIVANVASFFETDPFESEGERDKFTQGLLESVWTAMLGPEFGYCDVPCFETNCPVISKKDDMYEICVSSVNGIMYCHESTFQKYERRKNEITRRKLNDLFNQKPNPTLYSKCQTHRNSLECGAHPFQTDNFDLDEEVEEEPNPTLHSKCQTLQTSQECDTNPSPIVAKPKDLSWVNSDGEIEEPAFVPIPIDMIGSVEYMMY